MNSLFAQVNNLVRKMDVDHIIDGPGTYEAHGSICPDGLNPNELVTLVDSFGSSLYIKLIQPSGISLIVNSLVKESQIIEILEEAKDLGETVFEIVIALQKPLLFRHLFLDKLSIKINPIFFMHYDKFLKWISDSGFEELEGILVSNCINVIFVLEKDMKLVNDHLLVIGGDIRTVVDYINSIEETNDSFGLSADIIKLRNNNCSWFNGTKFLTPLYFYFKSNQLSTFNQLQVVFNSKLIAITIPFLASSTIEEPGNRLSTIIGYKSVKLKLNMYLKFDQTHVIKTYELFNWIYRESNTTDKLGIFRNITSLFLTEDADANPNTFLKHIIDISSSTKSSFDVYLKENIKLYFEQRKKIEDFLQGKLKEITDQISAVVGLMSKNLITTIGAILAAILAQVSKPNNNLASVAIVGYMIYIALNTAYGSIYTMISVRQSMSSYNHNIGYAKKTLNETDVMDLVGTFVLNKKELFVRFWWATLIISMVLLGVGAYLLLNPGLLAQLQSQIAPPKVTSLILDSRTLPSLA